MVLAVIPTIIGTEWTKFEEIPILLILSHYYSSLNGSEFG